MRHFPDIKPHAHVQTHNAAVTACLQAFRAARSRILETRAVTDDLSYMRGRSIALVGMPGVGKTTIGRRLSKKLDMPFYDSDEEIERASGRTVAGYFRDHGEAAFRAGERRVIERLLDGPPIILATGGGAYVQEDTQAALNAGAICIWLKANQNVIFERVKRKKNRPLLNVPDPKAKLGELLKAREPHYARAHIIVDANTGPHTRTVDRVIKSLRARYEASETSDKVAKCKP